MFDGLTNQQMLRARGRPSRQSVRRLSMLKTFVGLLCVDVALRTIGYRWLRRRLLRRHPITSSFDVNRGLQEAVVAAFERGARQYPRDATCLQRAVVLTWLLRQHQIPADLVIGCRHTPFYAHAWVEVAGEIVADRPVVSELYPEVERV